MFASKARAKGEGHRCLSNASSDDIDLIIRFLTAVDKIGAHALRLEWTDATKRVELLFGRDYHQDAFHAALPFAFRRLGYFGSSSATMTSWGQSS